MPPLDANRWLVLPLENRTAHPDSVLLRLGTSLQLQSELAMYPQVSVVEDNEVFDQLRKRGLLNRGLTISQAQELARHFGAGNIVLGEVLPGPRSVRVLARVYSTRSGQRTRLGEAITPLDTTFFGAMRKVAGTLLDLPELPQAEGPAVGTRSLDAWREYLLGKQEQRLRRNEAATEHYRRAIAIDSTMALAYYAGFWTVGGDPTARVRSSWIRAALRHSRNLPARPREKIVAAEAMARAAYDESCAMNWKLLTADSTDADVLMGLSYTCTADDAVVPDKTSPSGYRFRTSTRNIDLFTLRKLLEADPTNLVFYRDLSFIFTVNQIWPGCLLDEQGKRVRLDDPRCRRMSAYMLLDHDTLYLVPWPTRGMRPIGDTTSTVRWQRDVRAIAEQARPYLLHWRALAPDSRLARGSYANFAQAIGDPALALPVLRDLSGDNELEGGRFQGAHLWEVLFQLERPREAALLIDSLTTAYHAAIARGDKTAAAIAEAFTFSVLNGSVRGRPAGEWLFTGPGPLRADLTMHDWLLFFGVAPDTLMPWERNRALADSLVAADVQRRWPDSTQAWKSRRTRQTVERWRWMESTLGFTNRRTVIPYDTVGGASWLFLKMKPWLPRIQAALSAGDTATARQILREQDFELFLGEAPVKTMNDDHIWVGETYLAMGDSAAALSRMRDFARKLPQVPLDGSGGSMLGNGVIVWLPRFWLRYGDVAYAMHQKDEAIRAYRFIEGLWEDAEPFLQPTVQRVKARLAELTASRN